MEGRGESRANLLQRIINILRIDRAEEETQTTTRQLDREILRRVVENATIFVSRERNTSGSSNENDDEESPFRSFI